MNFTDSVFRTLRESDLNAVRDMAIYPDYQPAHHAAERMASSASNTAFVVLGHEAGEEGLREWERMTARV